MFSEGPPSLEDVTTSWTCPDPVEVKILTSSGMIAPASVPHDDDRDSFHQSVVSPAKSGIVSYETTKVRITETIEVSQTRGVSGVSKFISLALA